MATSSLLAGCAIRGALRDPCPRLSCCADPGGRQYSYFGTCENKPAAAVPCGAASTEPLASGRARTRRPPAPRSRRGRQRGGLRRSPRAPVEGRRSDRHDASIEGQQFVVHQRAARRDTALAVGLEQPSAAHFRRDADRIELSPRVAPWVRRPVAMPTGLCLTTIHMDGDRIPNRWPMLSNYANRSERPKN